MSDNLKERAAFDAWFKEKSPVGGVKAKLSAWDSWRARAAIAANTPAVPDGWDENQIAHAAMMAEISDAQLESLLIALPAAPQPQPVQEASAAWVPYLKEGETPFERFERERKDGDALMTLYGKELREIERLSEVPQPVQAQPSMAATDVLAERQRQISAEGWTPEHDDEHHGGQMAAAAACYALAGVRHWSNGATRLWPWSPHWWKPTHGRRDLVKAGALILAEIERLDRAQSKPANQQKE